MALQLAVNIIFRVYYLLNPTFSYIHSWTTVTVASCLTAWRRCLPRISTPRPLSCWRHSTTAASSTLLPSSWTTTTWRRERRKSRRRKVTFRLSHWPSDYCLDIEIIPLLLRISLWHWDHPDIENIRSWWNRIRAVSSGSTCYLKCMKKCISMR